MVFRKVPIDDVEQSGASTIDIEIGGVAPQLDDTDKIAASMYGGTSAAGDTAILVDTAGRLVQGFQRVNVDSVANGDVCFIPYAAGEDNGLLGSAGYLFNGATWDRPRNNHLVSVLASSARTTATNSADLTNHTARGIYLTIDVTADPASAIITPTIAYKADTFSNAYEAIMVLPTINAVGTHTYLIYPASLTAAANDIVQILQAPLPRIWRLQIAVADSGSMTYSAEASYIL